MAAIAGLKELGNAIETRSFDSAYLFVGDDDFRKHEALAKLIEAAVDPATKDFNLEVRRGSDISAESLGSILGTPPMLAERRMVVIRDAGSLKKDAKAAAEQYLERPSPDVVFVLIMNGGEKADPKFSSAVTVQFDPISGPRLAKWITTRAELFGAAITPGAVELLQNSVGNDLSLLNVELEKLSSFRAGVPIDEAAVSAMVGVRREETLPALLDAIAARDAREAMRILPGLLEQPKSSGVFVVMVLGMQIVGTGFAKARIDKRVPPARLEPELVAMIKESGAYPGRAWGDAVRAWIKSAPLWSLDELHAAAASLHAADRALKETSRTTEEGILQQAILAMCRSSNWQAA